MKRRTTCCNFVLCSPFETVETYTTPIVESKTLKSNLEGKGTVPALNNVHSFEYPMFKLVQRKMLSRLKFDSYKDFEMSARNPIIPIMWACFMICVWAWCFTESLVELSKASTAQVVVAKVRISTLYQHNTFDQVFSSEILKCISKSFFLKGFTRCCLTESEGGMTWGCEFFCPHLEVYKAPAGTSPAAPIPLVWHSLAVFLSPADRIASWELNQVLRTAWRWWRNQPNQLWLQLCQQQTQNQQSCECGRLLLPKELSLKPMTYSSMICLDIVHMFFYGGM